MARATTQRPTRASARARHWSRTPAFRALARTGLVARAVIYLLIGWVAILLAVGHSTHQPNQEGALQLLAGKPYGDVSLWLLGIGFAGYALWRLSEAAFGVAGEGNGAGPRAKSGVRALVYAFLCYLTFKVIAHAAGNETRKQQDMTASVMRHPGGQWLVAIIGLVIVAVGVALIAQGRARRGLHDRRSARCGRRSHVQSIEIRRARQGPADLARRALRRVLAAASRDRPGDLRRLRPSGSPLAQSLTERWRQSGRDRRCAVMVGQ